MHITRAATCDAGDPVRLDRSASCWSPYFAYGSNLDRADWHQFCLDYGLDPSGVEPEGPAILPYETLVFDYRSIRRACGVLDIRRRIGCTVEGYLFRVAANGWAALDAKEGHPYCYRRETVSVIDAAGREVEAQTYRVIGSPQQGFVAPNEAYLTACRNGRAAYGLPTEQLEKAAAVDGI